MTDSTTTMKIGAYATSEQRSGTYNNVVNFSVVSNVATHTVEVAAGSNVASVTQSGTSPYNYAEGAEVDITATCNSGFTFANWAKSADYGVIANPNAASTTYTVGAGNTILTAYCVSSS